MKKWLACGFVVLALSLFLCGAALAADAEGIQSPSISADGITAEVNASNRDILNLTYSGAAAGKEYVVFATSTDVAPTESNLVYIDQKTAASSGGVTFAIYPKSLTSGATYYIWLSSDAASGVGAGRAVKVGSFGYYTEKPAYTLGDVNQDGSITVSDALYVLDMIVGTKPMEEPYKSAADVDQNGSVTVSDALGILDICVGA
jgi:hypothetical protein